MTSAVWFHINWVPRIVTVIEIGSRVEAAGLQRGGNGELLDGSRDSFWDGEKLWRWMVAMAVHNIVNVLNTAELFSLKWLVFMSILP